MKQENTDENTRLWKGKASVCVRERERGGGVQLAAVYAIILPQAQRSIVCAENLPSPQIRMHDHAYVQTHKHMQTRRGPNRSRHYNGHRIPAENASPNRTRTQRCYFWPHLLVPM